MLTHISVSFSDVVPGATEESVPDEPPVACVRKNLEAILKLPDNLLITYVEVWDSVGIEE